MENTEQTFATLHFPKRKLFDPKEDITAYEIAKIMKALNLTPEERFIPKGTERHFKEI